VTIKLTPAKRLKQLRKSGWLEFVEHMEANDVTPKQAVIDIYNGYVFPALFDFHRKKAPIWMAEDIFEDMFSSKNDSKPLKMMGLAEMLETENKSKKNG